MSKRERTSKRERKLADRAQRHRSTVRKPKSKIQNEVAALIAAGAFAGGTQAYATVVRFDNPAGPGHFDWAVPLSHVGLDITRSAAAQSGTGEPGPSVFEQFVTIYSLVQSQGQVQVGGIFDAFLVGVGRGNWIPTGTPMRTLGYTYYYGYGSAIPEGKPTYLGVKFSLGAGNHYGWIGVVRTGMKLEAFTWGYETERGVPIAAGAPEPGSLAVLAFGAVGVLARRRRRA